jgi:hypothetical protein
LVLPLDCVSAGKIATLDASAPCYRSDNTPAGGTNRFRGAAERRSGCTDVVDERDASRARAHAADRVWRKTASLFRRFLRLGAAPRGPSEHRCHRQIPYVPHRFRQNERLVIETSAAHVERYRNECVDIRSRKNQCERPPHLNAQPTRGAVLEPEDKFPAEIFVNASGPQERGIRMIGTGGSSSAFEALVERRIERFDEAFETRDDSDRSADGTRRWPDEVDAGRAQVAKECGDHRIQEYSIGTRRSIRVPS